MRCRSKRKRQDSNLRYINAQRISNPPPSTSRPLFRVGSWADISPCLTIVNSFFSDEVFFLQFANILKFSQVWGETWGIEVQSCQRTNRGMNSGMCLPSITSVLYGEVCSNLLVSSSLGDHLTCMSSLLIFYPPFMYIHTQVEESLRNDPPCESMSLVFAPG